MTHRWKLPHNTSETIAISGVVCLVFVRFLFAEDDFSFDYFAYISFLNNLSSYSSIEILGSALFLFPYAAVPNSPLFEVGFVLFAKLLLDIFLTPTASYAALAAFSVGLRVYSMRKLGASWFWIIFTNVYGITLFEANALRLGIAASLIIYGLYRLLLNERALAYALFALAMLTHIQVALFLIPLIFAWTLRRYLSKSYGAFILILFAVGCGTWLFTSLIPQIDNAKVVEYINRGGSNSAGITFTSVGALTFALTTFFAVRRRSFHLESRYVWIAILVAALPSIILLMTLTSIAVIGDRAWQLACVIASCFIFTRWSHARQRRLPLLLLSGVFAISIINITIRYPLSNFFNFVLPHAEISTV